VLQKNNQTKPHQAWQKYKKTLRYTTLQNNITAYIVSTILKVAHNHANIKPASIGDTVTLCRKLNL
jgi:hypothetical protein